MWGKGKAGRVPHVWWEWWEGWCRTGRVEVGTGLEVLVWRGCEEGEVSGRWWVRVRDT